MKFWETHAQEMRKARLLQAAAIIYANYPNMIDERCVEVALRLEVIVEKLTGLKS